ncbi:MAG TPA: DinB family protein [Anaerolineae bacterium]|nr:DinB family protein [Anaerolineae bacterium]MCB0222504.1 DinB family protein [Anaerolineae bacterium]MCB9103804.1 DinB family protein [Anaerolineales bacterium]HRV95102.1 DinB family protein [Anaerolineae bacterium]
MINQAGLMALYDYNDYANRLLFDTIAQVNEADLHREVSPSHDSIFQLLYHTLGVEYFFLSCCRDQPNRLARDKFSSAADLRRDWLQLEVDRKAYLASTDDEALAQIIEVNFGAHQFQFPKWQVLTQAFVHSTHHRGELSVVLTELGHPLPTLDIIVHFAKASGQPWPW